MKYPTYSHLCTGYKTSFNSGMSKKKQNRINSRLLIGFFKFKPNTWIIVSSSLLGLGVFFYFLQIPAFIVFPDRNDLKFEFYTDSGNGGNSKILRHHISDTSIDLDFDLETGFQSPYVGIKISRKNEDEINLSPYNQIHIDIEGQNVKGIGYTLFTPNIFYKNRENSKELFFSTNLKISAKRMQYRLDLSQLRVPDWWCETNNVSPSEKINPDLKHVLHLTIGTAYAPVVGAKNTLHIYSISFERDNRKLIRMLLIAEFVVILFLFIIYFLRVDSTPKKTMPVTIEYKPVGVDTESRQFDGFLDYINRNFHESDLTLEQVSRSTGINQRRIASFIQQRFGCNFKTYINLIRINESKRLLVESELNMGEIAFKVGFNNQSHFNRVFKSMVGINPSEFREAGAKNLHLL
jgi:AraC-like DNA-binding protein